MPVPPTIDAKDAILFYISYHRKGIFTSVPPDFQNFQRFPSDFHTKILRKKLPVYSPLDGTYYGRRHINMTEEWNMKRTAALLIAALALSAALTGCGAGKTTDTMENDKVPTTNDTMPTPGTDQDTGANDSQSNAAPGNTDGGFSSTTVTDSNQDTKDTSDKVSDNARNAADDLGDAAKDVVDGAGDAVKGAGKAVTDVGDAVSDAVK
jgi:hypothetical protein